MEQLQINNVQFVKLNSAALDARAKAGITSDYDYYMKADLIVLDERRRRGLNKVHVTRVFWPENKTDLGVIQGMQDILVDAEIVNSIDDIVYDEKSTEVADRTVYNTSKCADAILDGYIATVVTADVCPKGMMVVNESGVRISTLNTAVLGFRAEYNGMVMVKPASGEVANDLVRRMIKPRDGNIYNQVEDPEYDGADDILNHGISGADAADAKVTEDPKTE